jgi:hypothetical protein
MLQAAQNLTVEQQVLKQRRERLIGAAALVACALAFAIALVLLTGPLPLVLGMGALLLVVAIAMKPRVGVYLLLFCALLFEQWGIVGLAPLTAIYPFYQTLASTIGFPVPVSPVELLLILTLAAVVLPHVARRGTAFVRGPLFMPLLLFLAFVVASIVYGLMGGSRVGAFDIRAAWEETRSFFYLGITYVLTCNLIRTRAQLRIVMWLFIAAISIKSLQGIARYAEVRANGVQVDAITGHEDVVFFATFVLLLGALLLFGTKLQVPARWQVITMLAVLLPLVFTLLVTNRRIGFVVLAAGLALLGVLLLRTRRDLFLRIVPLVILGLGIYIPLFWNNTGTLGAPIRAVRSIVAPATERDRSSNAWRQLENTNINYNIRYATIAGLGFGRPYAFIVAQPPIDATGFTYWRFIAHNAIYWVWMKMGAVGFILFWNVVGSAVVLGLVTFRQVRDGYLKAVALAAAGAVLMQIIFSYGDLGLTYTRSMIFLGCMFGVLAVVPALASTEEEPQTANAQAGPAARRWLPWVRPQSEAGRPG